MKSISVRASGQYQVLIGPNLLASAGKEIQKIRSDCKVAVISDSHVWPLYGNKLIKNLTLSGFESIFYVFPAGESSKNGSTYLDIVNFLAENKITRSDLVIAIGGGVVGDITGFAAATFLRGISYIQIPTSLLAMVDSSVGGKTAIDLPAGKNLVGAFKQPSLVLCDTETLNTLPEATFLDGCAEVIKYAMLYDAELFQYLLDTGPAFDREKVIARCIELKRNVVQIDEFDTGVRQKLNLGHTIGHGIEAESNYQVSHGNAVAAGMAIITRAACAMGYCPADVSEKLESLLRHFHLPTRTEHSADKLYLSALSDKKRSGGSVNLIIPRRIGDCEIVPTPVSDVKTYIKAGL